MTSSVIEKKSQKNWITTIHYSAIEVKALCWFRKTHLKRVSEGAIPIEEVIEALLSLVLCHPEQLSQWVKEVNHYCEAEGIDDRRLLLGRIANHPKYKRVRKSTV